MPGETTAKRSAVGGGTRLDRWEIILVLALYAVLYFVFAQIDFIERLYYLTREYEDWELDEFIVVIVLILPSALLLMARLVWKSDHVATRRGVDLARSEANVLDLQEALAYRLRLMRQIAHDLRNPMQGVLLLVDRVRRDPARASVAQDMDTIETTITRLAELLDRQLSDMMTEVAPARPDEGERAAVDLARVVRSAVELHRSEAAARSIPIRVDLPPTPLATVGDEALLVRAVSNLLSNALKYGLGQPVDVALRAEGDGAAIVVRDRGAGIAPDVLPLLFRPFVRGPTVEAVDGLGLGLAFVEEVLTAGGGRVVADSVPGEGSTFTLWLPRVAG